MNLEPRPTRRALGALALTAPWLPAPPTPRPGGEAPRLDVDDPVAASVAHPDRPAEDRARDADRRPARVLDFFDVKRGMQVADVMAGDGYYTEILARAVGPEGTVHCQNTEIPLRVFADEPLTARLARPGLENVVRLDREFDDPGFPEGLDLAILVRFYHDFGWQEVDRAAFNAMVFRVLRPGGAFGVVDHAAADGAGLTGSRTLHRVEQALVVREVEAAGFVLEAESFALRNPADARDWNVFRNGGAERDTTDRFLLLFRKPEDA